MWASCVNGDNVWPDTPKLVAPRVEELVDQVGLVLRRYVAYRSRLHALQITIDTNGESQYSFYSHPDVRSRLIL